jgi:hypothetical protein
MFHLVIVECESTSTPVVAGHGSQGAIIEAMLRRNADGGTPSTRFSHWNAVQMQAYPGLDGVDAMFLTGGGTEGFAWLLFLPAGLS